MKLLKKSTITLHKEENASRNVLENLKVPSLNLSTLKHVKEYTSQQTVTIDHKPKYEDDLAEAKPQILD